MSIVNLVAQYYDQTTDFYPRIQVVLVGQVTWSEEDPYTVSKGQCNQCSSGEE